MAGRKLKPYQATWGQIIPGLCHDVDGRWRVAATGECFTEANEAKAIERYYSVVGRPNTPLQITMQMPQETRGAATL
jgi:hypothetical protein